MPGRGRIRRGVLAGGRLCELVQLREVHDDRIGTRTGNGPDGRAVGGCVDLLVHCVRRNENEVSPTCLNDVLQTLAPPVPCDAFNDVEDRLLIAVVVRTGGRTGSHGGQEGAQYLGVGIAAVEGDVPEQPRGCGVSSESWSRRTTRTERLCASVKSSKWRPSEPGVRRAVR